MHLKKILSLNFNCWKPISSITLSKKIELFAEYIREHHPDISIASIQEFIIGPKERWLKELEKALNNDFFIFYNPLFHCDNHPRSIATLVLVRKSDVEKCEVEEFECCLNNRICSVNIWTKDGKVLKVVGVHMVQIQAFPGHKKDWYVTSRMQAHRELWKQIIDKIQEDITSKMGIILLGDTQENSSGTHMSELVELGLIEAVKSIPTVKNDFFAEQKIDHILMNSVALEMLGKKDVEGKVRLSLAFEDIDISDHSMLVAM